MQIYVEIERARLTRKLAQLKEREGNIAEAADVLQEVAVVCVHLHSSDMAAQNTLCTCCGACCMLASANARANQQADHVWQNCLNRLIACDALWLNSSLEIASGTP